MAVDIIQNAVKKALEKLVEVSAPKSMKFLGVGLLTVSYQAEVKHPGYPLSSRDTYLEAKEDTLKVTVNIPEGANAYSIGTGPKGVHVRESHSTYADYFPVAYFKVKK